jgi:hypothetical protein
MEANVSGCPIPVEYGGCARLGRLKAAGGESLFVNSGVRGGRKRRVGVVIALSRVPEMGWGRME